MRALVAAALAWCLLMRIGELVWSRRNERRLLGRGGRRIPGDGFAAIVGVHVLWITGMGVEELLLGPSLSLPILQGAAGLVFAGAELLRFSCIRALGERWSVRVLVLPGVPPVREGPYRWLRHPNYAAVLAGMVALPLALGLPVTAAAAGPAKLLALRRRRRVEDQALGRAAPSLLPSTHEATGPPGRA